MLIVISIIVLAFIVLYTIAQSQDIKRLERERDRNKVLLGATQEILWNRIIPNQQFPFEDMVRLIENYSTEPNAMVKRMYYKALTGKD